MNSYDNSFALAISENPNQILKGKNKYLTKTIEEDRSASMSALPSIPERGDASSAIYSRGLSAKPNQMS